MAADVKSHNMAGASHFPSARYHGSLSEYERPIMMQPEIPTMHFSVDGGTSYLRAEEEEYPFLRKPVPAPVEYESLQLDPTLCITPEKSTKSNPRKFKSHLESSEHSSRLKDTKTKLGSNFKGTDSSKLKGSQSVRFDANVDIRYLSPDSKSESRLCDSDDGWSQEDEVLFDDVVGPPIDSTEDEEEESRGDSRCKTYKYYINDDTLDVDPEPRKGWPELRQHQLSSQVASGTGTSSCKQRTHASLADSGMYSEDYQGLPSLLQQSEHTLARPEFLSTLRVSKEIQELQREELDVAAAVERKLKVSNKTREKINEKVVSKVNISSRAQYPELVSLEVRPEELADQKSKELAAKVRPTHKSRQPKPESRLKNPPDVMEFFTPDLQRETASLTLNGLPSLDVPAQTAELHRAFDVYQHIRAWEKW